MAEDFYTFHYNDNPIGPNGVTNKKNWKIYYKGKEYPSGSTYLAGAQILNKLREICKDIYHVGDNEEREIIQRLKKIPQNPSDGRFDDDGIYYANYDSNSKEGKTQGIPAVSVFKILNEAMNVIVKEEDRKEFAFRAYPASDKSSQQNGSATSSGNQKQKGNILKEVSDLIQEGGVRQIIFTGAPGTGKTYLAKKIAQEIPKEESGENKEKDRLIEFVQFHPSYDYTDFVEGLRPVQMSGADGMQFVKLDGIFKKFCRKVAEKNKVAEENKKQMDQETAEGTGTETLHFFLVDEINRADLSKVFGELMYCLEKDKRGEENRVQTQYQYLPTYDAEKEAFLTKKEDDVFYDVFYDGFYIPKNIVLIGTMNDIDRSVESMDFALRRRFVWKEFIVTDELLTNAFSAMDVYKVKEDLVKSIQKLNEELVESGKKFGLNRQYAISQGQFSDLPVKDKTSIKEIRDTAWNFRIEPLLREYLRGESETEINGFIAKCKNAFGVQEDGGRPDQS